MRRDTRVTKVLVAVFLAAILAAGLSSSTLAHEHREVGDFVFVVGFMEEPAYVNQMNGIDLRITRADAENGEQDDEESDDHGEAEPVENAHENLRAAVIYGGETLEVELRPLWGQPGRYTAEVIPTRTGTYSFQFIGEIEGQEINETFQGGPDTFSEVESTDALFFPSASAPTETGGNDQTLAIAIAGVVAGLMGLVAGAAGYYKATTSDQPRRRAAASQRTSQEPPERRDE